MKRLNIKIYRYLTLSVFAVLLFCSAKAQQLILSPAGDVASVYVGSENGIFVANKDTMAIFGSVLHNGTWGTTAGSFIYFMGQTWKNTPSSQFTLNNANDTGGIFFVKPYTPGAQIINGGFSRTDLAAAVRGGGVYGGPAFPNLVISNPSNVYLDSSDLSVSNRIIMDTGLVYMLSDALGDNTKNSFVLGGSGSTLKPSVMNYNRNKYFVSGVNPFDTSYFYVRNVATGDTAVFPLGSRSADFTPAGVRDTTATGDVMVRVFDGVRQNATSGVFVDTVGDPSFYLHKTWQVVTPTSTTGNYNLILEEHLFDETPIDSITRDQTFISKYDTSGWSIDPPTQPAYAKASIFPNIGNDGDSVFYHWRILEQILNSNTIGAYYTKRTIQSNFLTIDKSLVAITTSSVDSTYQLMFKVAVTNTSAGAYSNIAVADNLSAAFANPFGLQPTFSVASGGLNTTNGLLAVNPNFDGVTDTLLTVNGSLEPHASDTIYLLVNFNLNGSGVYQYKNTAFGGFNNANGQLYDVLDTSSVTFNVPVFIFVPDGFSPNNDGINDKFEIRHTVNQTVDLTVFNRWGNIVYKKDNYQSDWDGKGSGNLLGRDVEDGTYYAIVTIHDSLHGVSTIMKSITVRRSY